MKKNTLRIIACAVAGFGSLVVQQKLTAATYTWNVATTGTQNWNVNANWGGTGYPSAAGDVANLNGAFATATTIYTAAGTPTVGILNWGSTGSAVAITIGGSSGNGTITFNNNGNGAQINHTASGAASDYIRSNIILADNLTINVPNASYAVRLSGSITGTGDFTKTGSGYLYVQDSGEGSAGYGSSWNGTTYVEGGRLLVAGYVDSITLQNYSAITGNVVISNGARLQNTGSEAIVDTANISFTGTGGVWNLGGASTPPDYSSGYETIGSLTSAAGVSSDIYSGVLTLAGTSGTTSYAGTFGLNNTIALNKTGGSTQTLAGTAANAFTAAPGTTTAVSVTGGILQLDKTPGVDALTGPITVGDGAGNGRIRLLAANQINDASTFTFNAGTLDTNGFSEKLSTLTNAGASTIDMGAGASILNFANSSGQSWSGSIQVLDWSGLPTGGGTDQVLFGTDATGLSAGQLAAISFVNPNPGIWVPGTYGAKILTSGEIVPVPEPAILGTVALSGLLALRRRRRVRA